MRLHNELFRGLLAGLPDTDQDQMVVAIDRTRSEQLTEITGPGPQRRHRDVDGVLRIPTERTPVGRGADEEELPTVPI